MKAKELRKLSNEELKKKLEELRKELFNLNIERFSKKTLSNHGKYREIKRTIARILTILRERGL